MQKWLIGTALALAALGASDTQGIRPRSAQPRMPRTYSRQPF